MKKSRLFHIFDDNARTMHIIIDIRTKHLEDMLTTRYAVNWAKKWRKYHSSDECTFLILDDQLAPE